MITRRKEIYEELHPETRAGGDRKSEEAKSKGNDFRSIPSFSEDTATKTGVTPRTIRQEVQISKNIAPEVRCYTQEAIAEELGIPQQTVSDAIKNLTDNCQMAESGKNFKPELYTIWNFSKLGEEVGA